MTAAVLVMGGLGIVIFLSGLPLFRVDDVRSRTEPFLLGPRGRTSLLAIKTSASRGIRGLALRVLPPTDASLNERLRAAGLPQDPDSFRLEQIAWGGTGILGSVTFGALSIGAGVSTPLLWIPFTTILGVTGFLARDWYLGRQIETRRAAIAEQLPTAIDLLTLSIMSGESVPAALVRVGRVIGGDIGREFDDAVADMRSGTPTARSLEDLARRVPQPEVSRLVDALITGIERGAPLAEVLRAQADDCREARRRRLLELGGRREVVMLIPVVFLIMPVVVVFALLPGLVSLELLVP